MDIRGEADRPDRGEKSVTRNGSTDGLNDATACLLERQTEKGRGTPRPLNKPAPAELAAAAFQAGFLRPMTSIVIRSGVVGGI
jgi:hypothetical protein